MSEKVRRKLTPLSMIKIMYGGCFVVGLVLGLAHVIVRRTGVQVSSETLGAIALAVVALVVVASTVFSVAYWRVLDEAAREAHKFAWWWGGGTGGLVCLVAVLFVQSPVLEGVFGSQKPAIWLGLGMFAMVLAQILGYVVTWGGWWLARR